MFLLGTENTVGGITDIPEHWPVFLLGTEKGKKAKIQKGKKTKSTKRQKKSPRQKRQKIQRQNSSHLAGGPKGRPCPLQELEQGVHMPPKF